MATVSDWSANELENLFLDDMNLSDERGRRAAKIMAAVKAKEDEQDARLDAVAGGLVFRGTKASYSDLEAVTNPAVGDMYSVTALGGANYAWTGTAWDELGTSDANVVHKTGAETVAGAKTFSDTLLAESTIKQIKPFLTPETVFNDDTSFVYRIGGFFGQDNSSEASFIDSYFAKNYFEWRARIKDISDSTKGVGFRCRYAKGDNSKYCEPYEDSDTSLGSSSRKWKEVFAVNGSINTSDERSKANITNIPDEVLDAWEQVGFVQYQMNDAISMKGEKARLHSGLIAQRIDAAFKTNGLDASRYGLFCYDSWPEQIEVRGENGEVLQESTPAGDAYSLRYEEALCLEAACQRRRAERLEARVAALEALLDGKQQ